MIDFLKDCNISEYTLDYLYQKDEVELAMLNDNYEECIKIIEYLRKIEIDVIEELLMYKTELFYKSLIEIEKIFNVDNLIELVLEINKDFETIDKLY